MESQASNVSNVSSDSAESGAGWGPKNAVGEFASGAKVSLGSLLAESIPDNPTKQDVAAAIRSAKKKDRKDLAGRLVEPGVVPIPELPPIMELPREWNADMVKSFMQKLAARGVSPLESIQRDPRDPHYKKSGGPANLMTYRQTYTTVDKAHDVYARLARLPLEFSKEVQNQMRLDLLETNKWIMTNGPCDGLFERLKAGLERAKPVFKPQDYLPEVLRHYPIKRQHLRKLAGMGARDLSWVKVDISTGYGSPFMKPKVSPAGNFVPQMMEIAGEIMHAIATGTIDKWCSDHPALCVALLRNKLDKYLRSETKQKIRPYYTYPAHWNVLFSAIWQSISDASVGFMESKDSINAHRFSWAHGGAQKLYLWVESLNEPGVYVAAYSDDQLWVVVTQDGKKYLLFPDYKMMDMSLGVQYGRVSFLWLCVVYEKAWDKTWEGVAQLNCRFAFNKVVLICYALLFLIVGGLGSGIPGTAEFDQIASCVAMKHIKPALSGLADRAALDAALPLLVRDLKNRLGLEIKPETLAVHEFVPGQDYPWFMFLGHTLRRVTINKKDVYVPIRPRDKLVLSYVQPKGNYSKDGLARTRAMMSRLIGVTASGGWFYPEMYATAKYLYDMYAKQHSTTPAPENDMSYADFVTRPTSVLTPQWTAKTFPPVEWFQSIVAGWEVQVENIQPDRPVSVLSTVWTVSDKWGDSIDHDPFDQDVGATNVAPPPPCKDLSKQGMLQPLTAEAKRAYGEMVYGLRKRFLAGMKQGTPLVHKGRRLKKGEKLSAYLADQDVLWEQEADKALGEDDYEPEYEEVPDEVLEEMHRLRLDADDVAWAYKESSASRRRRDAAEELQWIADAEGE